jgi:hypothetical protein
MSINDRSGLRRLFGAMAALLFLAYSANIFLGKYAPMSSLAAYRVSDFGEFLLLLLSTGAFMVFAGLTPPKTRK